MLPKYDLPRYPVTLKATGEQVKVRPFTVKEQKILLSAKDDLESVDDASKSKVMVDAVKQVIELCSFGKINPDDLAVYDLENLFCVLRAKSVGNLIDIAFKDKTDPDEKAVINVQVNLDEVVIEDSEVEPKIMIDEQSQIGMIMKPPTFDMLTRLDINDEEMIIGCIDSIFDAQGVYKFADAPMSERRDYVEGFGSNILIKIKEYFESIPRITWSTTVQLKDGSDYTVRLRGLNDFFQ